MDFVSNLFKKSKSKNTTPQKQPEPCDNQNKNNHLFDMESSFLQNSVMIPVEFDSNQNSEPNGTNNSNQENQKPRYSILNSFDPIIKKESDELSCNENLLNPNVLNKSADFSNADKTFLNPIAEDFVDISAAVNDASGTELNKSSVFNISAQSDNSVLNNTVILNKSLTVKNITPAPEETITDANRSLNGSSTVKQSEQNLNTADQTFVNGKSNVSLNLSTTWKPTDISLPNVSDSDLIKNPDLNTPEQTFIYGSASLNESTLKPYISLVESAVSLEQTFYTADSSTVPDDISFNVSLKSLPDNENTGIEKEQNIKSVIDYLKVKDDIESADDSFINAFATKLVFSPNVKESDKTLVKDINTDKEISNEQSVPAVDKSNDDAVTVDLSNKCEINNSEPTDIIAEIPHAISVGSVTNLNDLIEDLNQIIIASDETESVEINKTPEAITNKTILIDEINTSYSEANEAPEFVPNKTISIDEISISNSEVNEASESVPNKTISIDEINTSNSEANEAPESAPNKTISIDEINTSNSEVNEAPESAPNKTISIDEISTSNSEVNEAPESDPNKTISIDEINTSNSEVNEAPESDPNKTISIDEINTSNSEVNEASESDPNRTISIDKINTSTSEVNEAPESVRNKNISYEINTQVSEIPEITTNKNISIEINTSNSQVIEDLNETLTEENINECTLENKNVTFEVINTSPQIVEEAPNEINLQLCNSTYVKSITDSVENIILSSKAEETYMSASEPNSDLNEPTVANRLSLETSAACTNDMGEIINQNECFEKQSDITNGAIDNKESLEAKARVYKEMAEQYAIAEAECEKFKVQVADLKKELKTCRQKTVALEAEVADLKRRENELNVLLAEYKQTAGDKEDVNDKDEQLYRLQASENALKDKVKELTAMINQHESRLKELQRKEVKLADDLTSKTQSEIQISRVMEEYEKSISSLISDNEKMKKDRDTAQMHLANIEMAFSDVHQKYERCKSIVQGYKDNEESYKQDIAMNRETIVIQEQKYESLKAHAMNQLEKSNQELATMKKQHETEMARLTAQLKRYEIKNQSLMESLQQKAKECEQLSAVCDEFIGNV